MGRRDVDELDNELDVGGEKTIVKTMPLPNGRKWAWYADANLIALAPGLSEEERDDALTEVTAFWRRSCLRIVSGVVAVGAAALSSPYLLQGATAVLT